MAQVNVTINGRAYRMACDDGEEERLLGLGRRFDETIGTLRSSFGEIGDQRLTVMAGVMMTDLLSEAERRIKSLESELSGLRESREAVLNHNAQSEAQLAGRVDEAAGRIEALAQELNKSVREEQG
ncbi:cell division protein ZapA [Breoghania corrubedonensis]|uniref:Cell division protein ZapA n=1 Tax=Breoghania corrubedonensis TaxID=665038 RepID=A0A2T5V7F5_9HYPH|nr:cell division protein ZapA [Breoghania corrubedonensis]PTW59661.1 cell division protein ZapA [Breoghania corrubedonensis]